MSRNTRKRILIASLLLFNEKGEPATTTNEIADEVDISPGNLHYHFRRKGDIVEALLAEFQADASRVLQPPEAGETSLDDFWMFLHLLLETTAAYRFLLRDMEALVQQYPRVERSLRNFARGLRLAFELQLHGLAGGGYLHISDDEVAIVGRNLAVIALFSDRFDALVATSRDADEAALRVARSVLGGLKPYVVPQAADDLESLATQYD